VYQDSRLENSFVICLTTTKKVAFFLALQKKSISFNFSKD